MVYMAAVGAQARGLASRLPHYEAVCSLATGGMAELHLARTRTNPPSLVVIKTLPEAFRDDPDRVDMLVDEARIGDLLRHPNIVAVHDSGDVDGTPYAVLEYVAGPSLRELLAGDCERNTTMDADMALTVAVGICDGLHYAHLATDAADAPLGLVHRDVSPQNVMIDATGMTRVLDFGVARAAGRRHETEGRAVKGKIAYTAPEYIMGATPDRRADVFGVGVLLWECLTSRRLFRGKTMAATVKAVVDGAIPQASVYNAKVPAALDRAIRGALVRDPEERYSSAAEMRDALFAAATASGGVLSPSQVARRLAARYPDAAGPTRELTPDMSTEELSARAIRVRELFEGSAEWARQSAPDTALEVDIDPEAFESPFEESMPDLMIPPDILMEED